MHIPALIHDVIHKVIITSSWWRHGMDAHSVVLALSEGNPSSADLNWDIFFKWNAFKITVMSCSICLGFNVLWWHHAVDTPSTFWFNDWRVVVNSVTYLLTPSRAAYPEIFTHGSLLSILPISSAINTPIIPMPMKQPWRIWVFKPQTSSRTHKSNQTKHNKIMCVFYG